ncbi:MLO-like protein 12 [Magnolia sinica]|uniref:MLO-like protein 12 n=1 Tax=Magnolia sinica TaxID=86752 RepID=UPI00265862F2|nr:MLO-like protein 12 [Magnolia sinica]
MDPRSLKDTPTWAVSIVCSLLILLSFFIEGVFHLLTKFLKRQKRKPLNGALQKIKTELMKMGFISLLLTVGEVPISRICVSKGVGNSFLPCDDHDSSAIPVVSSTTQISGLNTTISSDISDSCEAKGMVSLVSREGIMQLHIFIFVLAVFHVLYCVITMCLGAFKMKRWKTWEEETTTLEYQIRHDPRRFRLTRQTSFGQRHLKYWSNHPALLWPVCFLRQFRGSVTKADYFTLRNGFIAAHFAEGSNFEFQKFLTRTYDKDFEVVVGISFWIWIFSIFFIFFSAHVFYNHFWLPFIPLVMSLIVGTKLQVIITKMCLKSRNESVVVRGTMLVKPNDNLFWFGRPQFLLHLLHFILFQNSFQLAMFTWAWVGISSQ